jgi:hypothetical protein
MGCAGRCGLAVVWFYRVVNDKYQIFMDAVKAGASAFTPVTAAINTNQTIMMRWEL